VPQFASSGGRRKQTPYPSHRAGGLVQQGLSVAEALLVNIGLVPRQINAIRYLEDDLYDQLSDRAVEYLKIYGPQPHKKNAHLHR
jgi:hypothetical protein